MIKKQTDYIQVKIDLIKAMLPHVPFDGWSFEALEQGAIDIDFEQEKNINVLKILLANEATKILHGKTASKKAEKTAQETFVSGGLGVDLPIIKIKENFIKKGVNILDFLSY